MPVLFIDAADGRIELELFEIAVPLAALENISGVQFA